MLLRARVNCKSVFVQALLCSGLASLASHASASDTRSLLLMMPAGLDDSSMIFTYPGLAAEKSWVSMELGTPVDGAADNSNAYGGGLYSADFGTLGLYVSRDASVMNERDSLIANSIDFVDAYMQDFYFSNKFASGLTPTPARPLDLFYARKVGPGALGVRMTWAGDYEKSKLPETTTENTANQVDLQLGYSAPVASGKLDSSLRAGILGTIENKVKAEGNETTSTYSRGISLKLDVRYMQPLNSTQQVFAKTGFLMESPNIEVKGGGVSQDKDLNELQFDAQAGIIAKPRTNTTLAAGGAFFYSSTKGPFKLSGPANASILPVLSQGEEKIEVSLDAGKSEKTAYGLLGTVGIESSLTERWALLAGLAYPIVGTVSVKDKVTEGNPSYEFRLSDAADATLWSFGVAYTYENLRIDAGVNAKSLLHNGPQFITGNATKAPVYMISGTYDFSKSTAAATPTASLN